MPPPWCADADVRAVSAAHLAIARELDSADRCVEALDRAKHGLPHATAAARVDAAWSTTSPGDEPAESALDRAR